ncbi:helix-hairpin-helix domain-containing protein [Ornithinimicrobium sp. W1679]|uniref:helix-hairpin-helix domain-containing protein n=1 Tax=Ornithinimicrobium sp. W1679 TaxID=3418770 RepID=UPI003CFA045D
MSSSRHGSGTADPLDELLGGGPGTSEPPDGVENGRHRPGRVPLLTVPTALRSLELGVGPAAVRGMLVLVVVAALVLAGRWAWTTQRSDPVPQNQVESLRAMSGTDDGEPGTGTDGTPGPASAGAGTAEERTDHGAGPTAAGSEGEGGEAERLVHVVVHVTGQVGEPGVVTLPQGARVVDAVEAAGGLTAEADPSALNLARQLADGEQVWVGRPGEEPPAGLVAPGPVSAAGGGGAGGGGAATVGEPVLVVDLNRATQAELEELPGVGPVTAGRILAWRDEHGAFTVPEELLEVSGIGERTFEQLQPHVTVGG